MHTIERITHPYAGSPEQKARAPAKQALIDKQLRIGLSLREAFHTDFRLLGLHEKETLDSAGFKTEIEYYGKYDEANKAFSDLAVRETRAYVKNGIRVVKKLTEIEWYQKDGKVGEDATKTLVKHYIGRASGAVARRATENLADQAAVVV